MYALKWHVEAIFLIVTAMHDMHDQLININVNDLVQAV